MEIKGKAGSVEAMLGQQAVECRGEPMAGRVRQIRGHDMASNRRSLRRFPSAMPPSRVCLRKPKPMGAVWRPHACEADFGISLLSGG